MRIHAIEFETRVGFKLPSAGVTPAPSVKKSQNSEDAILLPGSFFLCHSAFPVSFQSGCCVITAELAKITHVASVELDNDDPHEIKIDVTVMDEDEIEDVRRQVPPKIEGYDTEVTQYVHHRTLCEASAGGEVRAFFASTIGAIAAGGRSGRQVNVLRSDHNSPLANFLCRLVFCVIKTKSAERRIPTAAPRPSTASGILRRSGSE